ncbi:MAG TPA: hypothetical protein VGR35_15485 [Tepidisphaeraceae bacterium]|nr:hypothetical protein [Tepidisphaeraceae bacterium]
MCIALDIQADDLGGKAPVNDVLLDRPIGKAGQRLVVTRGQQLDPALLKPLRPPSLPELQENYYEVRAELRSPNHHAVLLAARLRVECGTNNDKGSVVLDVLVEPGNIVLAMAEGPDLFLWRIGISQASTCWTGFQADKRWALAAASYRLDEKLVGMKLGRSDGGRLTVEVTEKLSGQHTLYEEIEKTPLQFKMIKQWRDKK